MGNNTSINKNNININSNLIMKSNFESLFETFVKSNVNVLQKMTIDSFSSINTTNAIVISNSIINGDLNIENIGLNINSIIDIDFLLDSKFNSKVIKDFSSLIKTNINTSLTNGIDIKVIEELLNALNTDLDSFIGVNVSNINNSSQLSSSIINDITNKISQSFNVNFETKIESLLTINFKEEIINKSGIFIDNVIVGGNINIKNVDSNVISNIFKNINIKTNFEVIIKETINDTFNYEFDFSSIDKIATTVDNSIDVTSNLNGSLNGIIGFFNTLVNVPSNILYIIVGGIVLSLLIIGVIIIFFLKYLFSDSEITLGLADKITNAKGFGNTSIKSCVNFIDMLMNDNAIIYNNKSIF